MRFPNAAVLKAFIQLKMPFQTPGKLKDAEYWRLTAFLLKQNGFWDGKGTLDASNAAFISISPSSTFSLTPTAQAATTEMPSNGMVGDPLQIHSGSQVSVTTWAALGGIMLLGLIAYLLVRIGNKW